MNMAALTKDIQMQITEKRICWSGVFAGTLVALIVGALLGFFGIGLGAVTFSFHTQTLTYVTVKSSLWFSLTAVISMFLGGWTAAHFSRFSMKLNGFLQGFLTYCLTIFISFLAVSTAFAIFVNGAFNFLYVGVNSVNTALEKVVNVDEGTLNHFSQMNKNEEMQNKTKEITENAINILGSIALINFVVLILGAAAAGLGGVLGVNKQQNNLD